MFEKGDSVKNTKNNTVGFVLEKTRPHTVLFGKGLTFYGEQAALKYGINNIAKANWSARKMNFKEPAFYVEVAQKGNLIRSRLLLVEKIYLNKIKQL